MKKKHWAFVLLLAIGVLKMPLEEKLDQELIEAKLEEAIPNVDLWDQVGQVFIMASLGGLRSLAASVAYLWSWVAWDHRDWGGVDSWLRITTTLEPHEVTYWEIYAWQMAYNAPYDILHEGKVGFADIPASKSAVANQLARNYCLHGAEILERGLQYLPNNHRLFERLGEIYRDKLFDSPKAATAFLAAYKNGSKDFYERMAAYELVKENDPAKQPLAYEILKRAYDTGRGVPSVVRDLPILEERLNIPKEKRINPAAPVPEGPKRKGLRALQAN